MGTQLPPLKGAQAPQFSVRVYCGQTSGWVKTPLGTEVDLGPGHIVLDRVPLPALRERCTAAPPLFGPCLLWPRSPISATAELLSLLHLKMNNTSPVNNIGLWQNNQISRNFRSLQIAPKTYLLTWCWHVMSLCLKLATHNLIFRPLFVTDVHVINVCVHPKTAFQCKACFVMLMNKMQINYLCMFAGYVCIQRWCEIWLTSTASSLTL